MQIIVLIIHIVLLGADYQHKTSQQYSGLCFLITQTTLPNLTPFKSPPKQGKQKEPLNILRKVLIQQWHIFSGNVAHFESILSPAVHKAATEMLSILPHNVASLPQR